jgi:hypothetical protein
MQWLCDFVLLYLPKPNLNLVELKVNLFLAGGLSGGREGKLTMVDRWARGVRNQRWNGRGLGAATSRMSMLEMRPEKELP